MEAVEFKAESEKQGRPIFKEIPHIRIVIPGDRSVEYVSKADKYHQDTYPQAWKRFEQNQVEGHSGTLLETWAQMNRALVMEAKFNNIHTVEQLAGLTDAVVQKMGMGWMEWRRKANAYLEIAAGTAVQSAKEEENKRLRDELEAMKAQIAALAKPEADKPARGRPRKEAVEAE